MSTSHDTMDDVTDEMMSSMSRQRDRALVGWRIMAGVQPGAPSSGVTPELSAPEPSPPAEKSSGRSRHADTRPVVTPPDTGAGSVTTQPST